MGNEGYPPLPSPVSFSAAQFENYFEVLVFSKETMVHSLLLKKLMKNDSLLKDKVVLSHVVEKTETVQK